METIIIENFGPIEKAVVDVRDINVFIGTTSSGKSTVAKLISIFKWLVPEANITFRDFVGHLTNYNIDFSFRNNTKIEYQYGGYTITVKEGIIERKGDLKSSRLFNPVYIPAERVFFSTVSQSIFSLLNNNIALPRWIFDFGAKFEVARREIKNAEIDFLGARYIYDQNNDLVELPDGTQIKLSQASSGLQSVIPLLLVILHQTSPGNQQQDLMVIEEPELNLYPTSQKDLLELIIQRINSSHDKLILTTHSPYILTSLDNLIQAHNVAKLKVPGMEINKVVSEQKWLDFNRVSCYFFDKGTCYSTLDNDIQSIGPSNIDNVSEQLSETFEKLLKLKYDQR